MQARDVMVSPVITIGEDEAVRDAARLLIENRISAVPVVDAAGKLVGIVSEGDLMRRPEAGTERPSSWWLTFLLGDDTIATEYVKSRAMKVKDVMTRDVKTASPETPLHEIADVFEENHIKRVPILSASGDLIGIISRANIIQAVASARPNIEVSLTDAQIRAKLLDQLNKYPWSRARKLNATVANGAIDLWGLVQFEAERRAITIAAAAIPGVTAVRDHLTCER